ncbi:MAG: hypothetical protein M1817_001961 [Caeruleum heppii]|nr:MAG: hypothetical protein M1817_001961 [Caeruleum heppii]
MLDPIPPPPTFIINLFRPLANLLSLTTLPLHIHEVFLAFYLYHLINTRVSPYISRKLFPTLYPAFPARVKINWDVHVVSLVQSSVINVLALWVLWFDEERKGMVWQERVWGYTGAGGMIQGLAAGYFLWDLMVTVTNVRVFGWGMLAHAISALIVFSLGFVRLFSASLIIPKAPNILTSTQQRPFVNYYGPTFILYELSSPFLNFHWFFDKVHMTGSRAQLYNGLVLLATFFFCRLVWGTYQSIRVYQDVWAALHQPVGYRYEGGPGNATSLASHQSLTKSADDLMRFTTVQVVPKWLAVTYLGSNIVLNTLNFYWFGKMIEAVRKRFQTPATKEKERRENGAVIAGDQKSPVTMSRQNGRELGLEQTELRRRLA